MANVQSIEFGLLINKVTYEEIGKAANHKPEGYWDDCVRIYNLVIETHPWNPDYIFVSWGELGDTVPEEPPRAKQIRKWFEKRLPKAKLKWQIIRTER